MTPVKVRAPLQTLGLQRLLTTAAPGSTPGNKIVFVTRRTFQGDLGGTPGVAGANAICNSIAADAGLPGSYKAWLSDTATSPSTTFSHPEVDYVLTTGEVVAKGWTNLIGGTLLHAIVSDEKKAAISATPYDVWTNTNADGTGGTSHCANWSSASGSAFGSIGQCNQTDSWTDGLGQLACFSPAHLYCFQQ